MKCKREDIEEGGEGREKEKQNRGTEREGGGGEG